MGTRGYHSYRGRGSTGKKVLAIVLGVILVAAGAFLLLQNRYVVYDENGNPIWECTCIIPDYDLKTKRTSSKKKEAKKDAAFEALKCVLSES